MVAIQYTFVDQGGTDVLVEAIVDHIFWDGINGHDVLFVAHIFCHHCRRLHIAHPALEHHFYLSFCGIFDPADVSQSLWEENGM